MINRVLDLSERPVRLNVRNSLLVIRAPSNERAQPRSAPCAGTGTGDPEPETYPCEHRQTPNEQTVPLSDIAVLVVSHPQISLTHAVLSGLAAAGGIFVACDAKHMPAAMLLPLATHSLQAERFAAQASLPLPNRKRLWQQIVRAKISAQAALLESTTGSDHGLRPLASIVRSGDPANVEARAARIYWPSLFPNSGFRRDPDGEGLNAHLNYGYAVLRAMAARALCAAGLHPALGIHHHNRYDAFPLADDLMEPFRPVVDGAVLGLHRAKPVSPTLDTAAKRALLEPLLSRFASEGESRTLFDWIARMASSLASAVESRENGIQIPTLTREGSPGGQEAASEPAASTNALG